MAEAAPFADGVLDGMPVAVSRRGVAAVLIAGTAAAPGMVAAFGLAWPMANRFSEAGTRVLAAAGPGRALLVGDAAEASTLAGRARIAAVAEAAVVDLSHARVGFVVEGVGARTLLSLGTTIDTRPQALPSGAALMTAIGRVAAVLLARGDARFDILVAASYADHVAEWLRLSLGARV